MISVNINILEISELKWTGIGEFNSDDHSIYSCGQDSLRRNGVALIVNKSLKCSTWVQSQKRQNNLCSFPRQTIQYHKKNTGVGCHFLLQGIFLTQGSNLGLLSLLHWILYYGATWEAFQRLSNSSTRKVVEDLLAFAIILFTQFPCSFSL